MKEETFSLFSCVPDDSRQTSFTVLHLFKFKMAIVSRMNSCVLKLVTDNEELSKITTVYTEGISSFSQTELTNVRLQCC